jgi:hypothetical protein
LNRNEIPVVDILNMHFSNQSQKNIKAWLYLQS